MNINSVKMTSMASDEIDIFGDCNFMFTSCYEICDNIVVPDDVQ